MNVTPHNRLYHITERLLNILPHIDVANRYLSTALSLSNKMPLGYSQSTQKKMAFFFFYNLLLRFILL